MSRRTTVAVVALLAAVGLAPSTTAAPTFSRLAGADRYATSAAITAARFAAGPPVVYVTTGQTFPDALAAGPVAGTQDAPVLLVSRDALPQPVADELRRLTPRRIVLIGGTGSVSVAVETQLRQYAPDVTRVAGNDRYATAAAVSASVFTPASARMAFVATGADYPDALSGSWAGARRGPLLLVTRDAIPAATEGELRRLQPPTIAVLGGPNAVSEAVVTRLRQLTPGNVDRLAGADRFATSAAVSRVFTEAGADEVHFATGRNFPDALAGGAAAAHTHDPVLLADTRCVPPSVRTEVDRIAPPRVLLLGGPAVLDDRVGALTPCGNVEVVATTLATGLQVPWDVAFVDGGRAYLTERSTGRLLLREADGTIREVQRFVVDPMGEGGLLGLAASPTFAQDGQLFAFMTSPTDNRIVRFRPGEPGAAILTGLPKGSTHDAGRLAFGPDGKLYASTGDAGTSSRSQDPASNAGKILRLNPDGTVPADNPTRGSAVWASGFRDPQGITWDRSGRMFADEFGPDRDDEVNVIERGGNYGWPVVTGAPHDPRFVDAVVVRQPPEASWSGNEILLDGAIPQWEGDLFVAALRGTRLYRFDLAADGSGAIVGSEPLYTGVFGRLRHVEQAPDGSLWLLTSNRDGRGSPTLEDDRIIRLGPR